jgi:hypothetical protein
MIPKGFRNPYIEEEQTTQWPKEIQYLYKPNIDLFMADHVLLSVKGKLLFWSMQILCKQN